MKQLLILFFLLGCAMDVTHKGGITTTSNIDKELLAKIESYCEAKCREQLPGAPEELINECKKIAMADLAKALLE